MTRISSFHSISITRLASITKRPEQFAGVHFMNPAYIMKLGANHPMGPLELADFIGLDTCLAILEVLQAELGEKYRPCPLLQKMVAGESAKLGQPEVNLGLIPGFGGTQRLSRLVGVWKAKEMIFTGEIIDAKETESIGLVNRVEKDEELMAKAEEMAQVIAQKAPVAVKMVKALINENQEIKEGLEKEIDFFVQCFATQDRLEGINAFLEKRKPNFKGI